MKTYTLSWKHKPYFGRTLSRCGRLVARSATYQGV